MVLFCFSHLLSVSFSHLCLPKLLRTFYRYGIPVNSNVGVKMKKTMRIKDIIFSPYTMVHSIHLLLVLKLCKVKVKIHVLYRLF